MQTDLAPAYRGTPDGEEAEAILRSCVHCGFCTATCPTYQLLGDELDGPRGRIYLIKQVLEGGPVTAKTQLHLDRCLTCRSCETTCPSGVQYGRLVDIGRRIVEDRVGRSPGEAARRWSLRKGLQSKVLFGGALALGRIAKAFVPAASSRAAFRRRAAPERGRRRVTAVACSCSKAACSRRSRRRSTRRSRACSTASAFRSSASPGAAAAARCRST